MPHTHAAELVPYQDGMTLGQGYNTFIQQTRTRDSVIVTEEKPPTTGFTKSYMSEEIETYEKLATTLNISAGAAISGYGASSSVDFEYLNKNEVIFLPDFPLSIYSPPHSSPVLPLSSTTLTVIKHKLMSSFAPKVRNQHVNLSNFINGGHFFARVSIFSEDKSNFTEIKQSSKTAFTMYGVTGEVTQEVKNAVENLKRLSTIRIIINETSSTNSRGVHIKETRTSDLLAVKALADAFYKDVNEGRHNYRRFALLEKYDTLSDFHNFFQPLDYTEANKRSWELFDDFMDYLSFERLVKDTQVPPNKYKSGEPAQSALETARLDNVELIRAKIATITKDPSDSRTPGTHLNPHTFRASVLDAVVITTYIAQRKNTPDNNWTEIAQKTLSPGAEKMFEFKAFDFGTVQGTSVISFGKKTQGNENMFICLIGARAGQGLYTDWTEESYFWTFATSVQRFAHQKVELSRLDAKQYLRIAKGASGDGLHARAMFDFFAVAA
ncbi:hypothetical protein DSL72_006705 [Monilinia vaccinii-corymbosi]|uniref:MACPF domain-containing protein n=1 Tax=Monilinia vaccinii-corymbosi TaxID=61207 RepID=A0A8A3PMX2_9HELO|nr:hypothetical protein DSL72_006705 [Monilinia vaccinii-corymbosi]